MSLTPYLRLQACPWTQHPGPLSGEPACSCPSVQSPAHTRIACPAAQLLVQSQLYMCLLHGRPIAKHFTFPLQRHPRGPSYWLHSTEKETEAQRAAGLRVHSRQMATPGLQPERFLCSGCLVEPAASILLGLCIHSSSAVTEVGDCGPEAMSQLPTSPDRAELSPPLPLLIAQEPPEKIRSPPPPPPGSLD